MLSELSIYSFVVCRVETTDMQMAMNQYRYVDKLYNNQHSNHNPNLNKIQISLAFIYPCDIDFCQCNGSHLKNTSSIVIHNRKQGRSLIE